MIPTNRVALNMCYLTSIIIAEINIFLKFPLRSGDKKPTLSVSDRFEVSETCAQSQAR